MESNLSPSTESAIRRSMSQSMGRLTPSAPSTGWALLDLLTGVVSSATPVTSVLYSLTSGALKLNSEQSDYNFLCSLSNEVDRISTTLGTVINVLRGPELSSIIFKCLSIAQRLDLEEKRVMLRNALVNTIFRDEHERDFRDSFFALIEELTPTQIKYLQLGCQDIPSESINPFTYNNCISDYNHIMINIHNWAEYKSKDPSLTDPEELKYWVQPLLDRGLLTKDISGKIITSKLGKRFLKFITTDELPDKSSSTQLIRDTP